MKYEIKSYHSITDGVYMKKSASNETILYSLAETWAVFFIGTAKEIAKKTGCGISTVSQKALHGDLLKQRYKVARVYE